LRFLSEFRDSALAKAIITQIRRRSKTPARFMEFCGGHTVTIFRYGIRQALPKTIEMLSGPGCPVCVTATADLDKAIALVRVPEVIVATFGDMLKVPGSYSSLQQARAEGADVRMVYSTMDAVRMAEENPDKRVVFLGIGFETTAPTVAASVLEAEEKRLDNYTVLSLHKLCPPVIKALLDSGEVRLDGLICPGHVSAVIGSDAWNRLMDSVFEPCPARWRGMGTIPGSGLKLKSAYRRFDADHAFDIDPGPTREPEGCICGAILRGTSTPLDCGLFGKACTPTNPVGPCMVSAEGSCSTYYLYGGGSDVR